MTDEFKTLGYLPDIDGFQFTGITKDGKLLDCVVKLVDGMHTAYSNGKPCSKELRYWRGA